MNTLNITIENNNVVSRLNGEGEGTILCGYVDNEQVERMVRAHNMSETINPTKTNAKAVFEK